MSFTDVQGRCPACGWTTLFLASGGYITCSRADCPDPDAASTLLERDVRTHPTTCDATELVTGFFGTPVTFGPCVLRHGHEGVGHKGANGAQWWPNGHTHADTANRAVNDEVAVGAPDQARETLREVLDTFAVVSNAGVLVGYAGPGAVHPDDFERWHSVLGTAPWPNLKEAK